jgi:hypothetical protein
MWQSDLEATRFALAAGSIMWAVFLFWPGPLFTPERATYRIMAEMAHELVWASAFLVQGVVMTYSLLWGYRSRCYFLLDALLGCFLWTASTAACFLAHFHSIHTYQPPAAMSYELIGSLASWWCLVRFSIVKKEQM